MSATSAFARRAATAAALLLFVATPASAHRVDEYLQATTIAVEKNRVAVQLRLTPGVAVFPALFAEMDANGDGVLSAAEQRAYVERVLRDLSLTLDGERLPLRLGAVRFARVDEMRDGRGEIQLDVEAVVRTSGGDRRLTFENRHMRPIGVYLVNALVPRDPDIRIMAQHRNYEQSFYRLDYAQAGAPAFGRTLAGWSGPLEWFGMTALLPVGWLALRRERRAADANARA